MKHFSALITAFALFAVITPASAQTKKSANGKNYLLGAHLIMASPVGTLSEDYKTGFGIEGIGGIKAGEQLYVTATLAYVNFPNEAFYNNYGNISVTSIKGGVRYYATENVFLGGNAGVGFAKDELEPRSYGRFIGDIGAGVHFGLVQAGLFYEGRKKIFSEGFANSVQVKLGIALR
ncbi:MAG TPA: hypothetical protein VFV46_01655 [Lacibacter sp.]|nr:hypothetical protein [Lacibacter sp.]